MEQYVENLRVPGSDHKEKEGKKTRGQFKPLISENNQTSKRMRAPRR